MEIYEALLLSLLYSVEVDYYVESVAAYSVILDGYI